MPATMEELGIDRWPAADRRVLAVAIWDSLNDEIVDANDGEYEECEKAMINERLALADANPGASQPVADVFEQARKNLLKVDGPPEHPLEKYAGTWDDPAMMELYRNSLAEYRAQKDRDDGIEVTDAAVHH